MANFKESEVGGKAPPDSKKVGYTLHPLYHTIDGLKIRLLITPSWHRKFK